MEVHRALGPGFLESIYRNALSRELLLRGLSTNAEFEVHVKYKDFIVGRHRIDLLVEERVIVELKATHGMAEIHFSQALSYMKATNLPISLIINFGESSLTWKRIVRTRS
jgi:GxxExxY protein